jgi:hypothetical protein
MRILFIGDIVAGPGRKAVGEILPALREKERINFVVANVENVSEGRGAELTFLPRAPTSLPVRRSSLPIFLSFARPTILPASRGAGLWWLE